MEIQPHEQRVIDEQKQLQDKLDLLHSFLNKGQPEFINDILKQRISLFGVN